MGLARGTRGTRHRLRRSCWAGPVTPTPVLHQLIKGQPRTSRIPSCDGLRGFSLSVYQYSGEGQTTGAPGGSRAEKGNASSSDFAVFQGSSSWVALPQIPDANP